MSVTTALLGFRFAHTAGHARSAGLRGAGFLVPLRTTRLRRLATAGAPPPPPHEAPPSQADTPPSSWEPQHQQQVEENQGGRMPWMKVFCVGSFLVSAYVNKTNDPYMAAAVLLLAVVALFIPMSD